MYEHVYILDNGADVIYVSSIIMSLAYTQNIILLYNITRTSIH